MIRAYLQSLLKSNSKLTNQIRKHDKRKDKISGMIKAQKKRKEKETIVLPCMPNRIVTES